MLHTGYKVIGYMFAKQSYWYKLRGLLFKLRRPRAFQLSRGLLLGAYWLAGSRSPDGGGESHHFMGNWNPSPGRLPAPAPAAPHNNTYFSASKPTRKISDTWIIDTGKRETSYRLVKIYQTIRQPHTRIVQPRWMPVRSILGGSWTCACVLLSFLELFWLVMAC